MHGSVAVVTGGGSGIGRATALHLAAQGATVVICGRRAEPLEQTVALAPDGAVVQAATCDVRDPEQVDGLVDGVLAEHGRIDALVNNAGGQYLCAAEDITPKGFRTVVALNLEGTWLMTHAVATKAFIPGGRGGRVVSLTMTPHTGLAGMAHSVAARAGVEALMKVLTIEWARYGIGLVAVAPGIVETDAFLTKYPEVFREHYRETVLAGELVQPEHVAATIGFLVSPAGRAISGSVVNVDLGHDVSQVRFPPPGLTGVDGRLVREARARS